MDWGFSGLQELTGMGPGPGQDTYRIQPQNPAYLSKSLPQQPYQEPTRNKAGPLQTTAERWSHSHLDFPG